MKRSDFFTPDESCLDLSACLFQDSISSVGMYVSMFIYYTCSCGTMCIWVLFFVAAAIARKDT